MADLFNQTLAPGISDLIQSVSGTLRPAGIPQSSTAMLENALGNPLGNPGFQSITNSILSALQPEFSRQQRNLNDQFRMQGGAGSLSSGAFPAEIGNLGDRQTSTATNAILAQAIPFINSQQSGMQNLFTQQALPLTLASHLAAAAPRTNMGIGDSLLRSLAGGVPGLIGDLLGGAGAGIINAGGLSPALQQLLQLLGMGGSGGGGSSSPAFQDVGGVPGTSPTDNLDQDFGQYLNLPDTGSDWDFGDTSWGDWF